MDQKQMNNKCKQPSSVNTKIAQMDKKQMINKCKQSKTVEMDRPTNHKNTILL